MKKELPITGKVGVFPKVAMSAVALASFMDSFCLQIIVPNLPFAVKKWFPGVYSINDTDVGFYYGYIVSAYSLGGIFGALFWGWFADSFGRKTSIITCLSCNRLGQMVLSICFGLAPNYYLALIIRTLWGFTNGNLGVLKTYVSEMCSEDKQSLGFSILVTMGGISNVVGPSLGGFLGDAETYFPSLVRSYPWIRNYPLFLPCLTGSILSVFILIMVVFALKESLTRDMIKANAEERKKSHKKYLELKAKMKANPDYVPSIDDRYIIQINEGGYLNLIQKHDVIWSTIMYGFYAIIQGGEDAIYPVWLINTPENHGFSFTSSDLGWMYTGLSPNQIISTPLLYPLVSRLLTNKQVSYLTGCLFSFFLFLSPIAALFNRSPVPIYVRYISLLHGLDCGFLHLTNGMVFITNSTYQDFRAKVNGLGQVMSAFGRFIGPTVATSVFSWSYKINFGFPLDYGCSFYLLGIGMIICTCLTCVLPESINHRKTTLREYVQLEHDRLEAQSIELVNLKAKEQSNDSMEEKVEVTPEQASQSPSVAV
ncbi:protein zinc induced facilitator-like protein [Blastocystis sp. subtype 4]|uniref:protein zinc induced facilitator-like protein n=1 Tax=Blastocystis sp. subtype 4 TaxID=944170 RepID=UPI0007115C2F|nr:protein zinc induced facilitator-like protein [Blastocystis sp. subtype 4]KNB45334.1 protein zinc induced facilitator-like protein [Blastocystis sp. subtype 4]|eukprot:XP_014528777.1 protein zinc induced facilitator-like protein [Blastocystis sp. subtype 4]